MKQTLVVVQAGRITETKTPLQALARYLQSENNVDSWHLFHPLRGAGNPFSYIYHNKKLVKKMPELTYEFLQYFREFFSTLLFLLRFSKPIDVYIGMSGFDMLPAALLSLIHLKTIRCRAYYCIDHVDVRFSNILLNSLYHLIDKVVIQGCHFVITNSVRTSREKIHAGARQEQLLLIPNGVYLSDIPKVRMVSSARNTLFYEGYLDKTHGVEELINIFPQLLKKNHMLRLIIAGTGPSLKNIKKLINKRLLTKYIRLVEKPTQRQIYKLLSQGGIGLAPYTLGAEWVKYCDPTKIKEYLACGCPVIVSSVVECSAMIEKENVGISYSTSDELIHAILSLSNNKQLFNRLSKNTLQVSKRYDYGVKYQELMEQCVALIRKVEKR